jgi:outer membrane protein assembly factor BamB
VVALSQSSGKPAWTVPTTSAVRSSAAAASGDVFVGSENGTVYAINQATGDVQWQTMVGGAVEGSPAVDPSKNEVIVGDASGAVTALSMTSGATLWSKSTGGSVTATASITNGVVLIGSASDKVYELNETTGAVVWTYNTKAAVTSRGSVYTDNRALPQYLVGDSAGNVYFLNISSGALVRLIAGSGSAVTGTTAPYGFAMVSFANGYVLADKFADELTWTFQSSESESPPTTLNGVVYLAGQDGTVRAFTVPGTQIP